MDNQELSNRRRHSPVQRILVLTDFSNSAEWALRYAVGLSKSLGATIQLFHAGNPLDGMKSNNPSNVLIDLQQQTLKIEKRFQALIEAHAEGCVMGYDYAIGNQIKEIKNYVQWSNPDLVILGKGRNKWSRAPWKTTTEKLLSGMNVDFLVSSKPRKDSGLGSAVLRPV